VRDADMYLATSYSMFGSLLYLLKGRRFKGMNCFNKNPSIDFEDCTFIAEPEVESIFDVFLRIMSFLFVVDVAHRVCAASLAWIVVKNRPNPLVYISFFTTIVDISGFGSFAWVTK
jgi:hypothetical protein